jgi:hypothetical protein
VAVKLKALDIAALVETASILHRLYPSVAVSLCVFDDCASDFGRSGGTSKFPQAVI